MAEAERGQRRKHPRIKVPRGTFVGWKSASRQGVSSAQEMSMGGLFLFTSKPAAVGATMELVFETPAGEIRARARRVT